MPASTSTLDDLKTAFAGESQANRKYLAYAQKAQEEGYPNIARLFRAAAEAETVHAHGHLKAMGGVRSTLENLKDAVGGETYEFTKMYPPMLEQAQKENHKGKAMIAFALKAEKVHAELYAKAEKALASGKDLAETEAHVCPVCGHVELGQPPAKCPICGAPTGRFQKVS